jgi:D-glycerate 3-kinase
VVVIEGWMLGFSPLESDAAAALDPSMQVVNALLKQYSAIDGAFDTWLVLAVDDIESKVLWWRLEAEQRMRLQRGSGLTDEQVRDFVLRFMPAYAAYLPQLYSRGPAAKARGSEVLKVHIVVRFGYPESGRSHISRSTLS